MVRFQRHGGKPIALVGGGTGMIGDPSGRSSERNLLDLETLAHNVAAIRGQLEHFLDFSPGPTQAEMANNLDWLGKLSLIDYLRDTGKHFTIPYMLAKDSVQQRLERGLSFTEFSYMTLQALDFATLYREQGVEMQMGGADQWGNITAGLELIRRTVGRRARRARRTGSRTSCCCRRRARSSARARAASRCGSTRPGRRPTRSTSTGSTPTTATSARTSAGSRCSSATRSRRWTPRWRAGPSSARRSGGSRST